MHTCRSRSSRESRASASESADSSATCLLARRLQDARPQLLPILRTARGSAAVLRSSTDVGLAQSTCSKQRDNLCFYFRGAERI